MAHQEGLNRRRVVAGTDLDRCKHCGGEPQLDCGLAHAQAPGDSFFIFCQGCGMTTLAESSIEKAVGIWNRRAGE